MKVKELIATLQECDPEMEIVVEGGLGGCDNPRLIEEIEIAINFNGDSIYAKSEELDTIYGEEDLEEFKGNGGIVSKAIIIRR